MRFPRRLPDSRARATSISLRKPDLAEVIDGAIGEASAFEEQFGYYAHGVGPKTAMLPVGWEKRLVKIQNENTNGNTGYCLDPHDLAASKLGAFREKDREFVRELLRSGIVGREALLLRIAELPVTRERRKAITSWIGRERTPPARPAPRRRPRRGR